MLSIQYATCQVYKFIILCKSMEFWTSQQTNCFSFIAYAHKMQEDATWHVCKENDNIYVVPWLLKLMGSKNFSSLLEGTKIKIMKFRATREVNKSLHYFLSCSTYFLYKIKLIAFFLGVPKRCKRCQNMLFCALASCT